MSNLIQFSNELADIVDRVAPSVFLIRARRRFNASGIHWSRGIIVSAAHILGHSDTATVFIDQKGEQKELRASIIGRDPGTDLAVLKVEGADNVPLTPRAEQQPNLRTGNLVLSIGRNKESSHSALGVISSIVNSTTQTWNGGKVDQLIRLNLVFHPVGTGGPIVDASGNMIGMATPALSRTGIAVTRSDTASAFPALPAFAVPNSTIHRIVKAVVTLGRIPEGYLGAGLQPIELPDHLTSTLGLNGARIGLMTVSVERDSPAANAGLMLGDVLLELKGKVLTRSEDVKPILSDSVGETIPARILRGGALVQLSVTIGERK